MHSTTTMLASISVTLIFWAIILISAAIQYLAKAKKKMDEDQRRRQAQLQRQTGLPPRNDDADAAAMTQSGDSLEEIAARRRAELSRLARQGSTPRPGQPANLTLQQMRERAQAKIAYDRRAAALRQGASNPTASAPSPAPRPPQAPAPTGPVDTDIETRRRQALELRRRAQAKAQAQAQRQAQLRAQATARSAPARSSAPLRSAPAPAPTPITPASIAVGAAQLGDGVTQVMTDTHDTLDTGESTVHRHISDVASSGATTTHATIKLSKGAVRLTPQSLRDVFVLKEVLDPPLALRTP